MMANWTRGNASITIRATGPVGPHYIQIGNAISYMYLNVIQSPIPYTNGGTVAVHGHQGQCPRGPQHQLARVNVAPTVSQFTTVSTTGLDPASSAVATLSQTAGPVNTPITLKVTGLSELGHRPTGLVDRRGQPRQLREHVLGLHVRSRSAVAPSLTARSTPTSRSPIDSVAGTSSRCINASGLIEAQVPFYMKESIVPFTNKAGKVVSLGVATADDTDSAAALAAGQSGTGTYTFHEGQEFTISINGVGWTQLDNTLGVDYDNSYMGYGCGFNSNGYMVVHLHATAVPACTSSTCTRCCTRCRRPSLARRTAWSRCSSYAHDYPGLALGYQVPSIHFAIRVVK